MNAAEQIAKLMNDLSYLELEALRSLMWDKMWNIQQSTKNNLRGENK